MEWTSTCRWCGVRIGRAARNQDPLVWVYYNLTTGDQRCRVDPKKPTNSRATRLHQPERLPDLTDPVAVEAWLSS